MTDMAMTTRAYNEGLKGVVIRDLYTTDKKHFTMEGKILVDALKDLVKLNRGGHQRYDVTTMNSIINAINYRLDTLNRKASEDSVRIYKAKSNLLFGKKVRSIKMHKGCKLQIVKTSTKDGTELYTINLCNSWFTDTEYKED